ncbi:hypothetical protein JZ751_023918 [Albula glossodonta]|uniref:Uncharacterized protein n=1 Tax=Albula glossodonta TaxID=121402 RepID=A0A8T2NFB2_9TELE|nr:hypothetical protein JZ751_023918 [Albula glossodonta]
MTPHHPPSPPKPSIPTPTQCFSSSKTLPKGQPHSAPTHTQKCLCGDVVKQFSKSNISMAASELLQQSFFSRGQSKLTCQCSPVQEMEWKWVDNFNVDVFHPSQFLRNAETLVPASVQVSVSIV